MRLWIHLMVTGHYPGRVPPFGNSGINVHLQLPLTFRSLSRPSSAISALASTLRSCSLDRSNASALYRPRRPKSSSARAVRFSCFFVSSLCSFQRSGFQDSIVPGFRPSIPENDTELFVMNFVSPRSLCDRFIFHSSRCDRPGASSVSGFRLLALAP